MSTYPTGRAEFLTWAEAHVDQWQSQAQRIGISDSDALAFKNQVLALRAKTTKQQAAKDAAAAATEAARESDRDTRALTSNLVRTIRAFAQSTNDPEVYQLAQIPAPSAGTPVPPPGQPTDFKVELNSDGSITIRWKARHPEGSDRVVYFVQRKLVTEGAFTLVGGTGERAYTDQTLPIGINGATYIVTAQRGQVQGAPSRQLTVTFGSGRPGVTNVRFSETAASSKKVA